MKRLVFSVLLVSFLIPIFCFVFMFSSVSSADSYSSLKQGWNGLRWGTTMADFKARFPKAEKNKTGWTLTGEGKEKFLGFWMDTAYGFTHQKIRRLVAVALVYRGIDTTSIKAALIKRFGQPTRRGEQEDFLKGALIWDEDAEIGLALKAVENKGSILITYKPLHLHITE